MKKQSKKASQAQIKKKKRLGTIGYVLLGLLVAAILAWFYFTPERPPVDIATPPEPPFTRHGQLTFFNGHTNDSIRTIDIEVAADEISREKGLMWRRSMSRNQGMLFIFEEEQYLSFWMKNTFIPLDIIYVDNGLEIVSIHEYVLPLSERSIPSPRPARYVVEVVGGFCQTFSIGVGDRVVYELDGNLLSLKGTVPMHDGEPFAQK